MRPTTPAAHALIILVLSCVFPALSGASGFAGGTGLTTTQMKAKTTFLNAGWDFVNTWCMPVNDYPRLKWEAVACGVGQ